MFWPGAYPVRGPFRWCTAHRPGFSKFLRARSTLVRMTQASIWSLT